MRSWSNMWCHSLSTWKCMWHNIQECLTDHVIPITPFVGENFSSLHDNARPHTARVVFIIIIIIQIRFKSTAVNQSTAFGLEHSIVVDAVNIVWPPCLGRPGAQYTSCVGLHSRNFLVHLSFLTLSSWQAQIHFNVIILITASATPFFFPYMFWNSVSEGYIQHWSPRCSLLEPGTYSDQRPSSSSPWENLI